MNSITIINRFDYVSYSCFHIYIYIYICIPSFFITIVTIITIIINKCNTESLDYLSIWWYCSYIFQPCLSPQERRMPWKTHFVADWGSHRSCRCQEELRRRGPRSWRKAGSFCGQSMGNVWEVHGKYGDSYGKWSFSLWWK